MGKRGGCARRHFSAGRRVDWPAGGARLVLSCPRTADIDEAARPHFGVARATSRARRDQRTTVATVATVAAAPAAASNRATDSAARSCPAPVRNGTRARVSSAPRKAALSGRA